MRASSRRLLQHASKKLVLTTRHGQMPLWAVLAQPALPEHVPSKSQWNPMTTWAHNGRAMGAERPSPNTSLPLCERSLALALWTMCSWPGIGGAGNSTRLYGARRLRTPMPRSGRPSFKGDTVSLPWMPCALGGVGQE